ncbi:MAG: glucose 1-dehydrogenase [Candidatus Hydrothermarchaeales archaeon]
MRAIAVTPMKEKSARMVEIEGPEIDENEVLVRVLQVGIDGTDNEINDGLYGEAPEDYDFLVLGHESLGVVEEVGASVADFEEGNYVVATVRRPDDCLNCRRGEYDMCLTGNFKERGIKGLHGFMTQYYKEEPEYLIKVPEECKDVGVLLEPLSVVEKAIFQAYKIQKRLIWDPKIAVVLGTGTIGILAAFILRNLGLDVYGVARGREKGNPKAALIKECGGRYISAEETPIKELKERLGNIDLIIEATGNAGVAFEGMEILGTNGVIALSSITGTAAMHEICMSCLNLDIVLNNKVVFGTVNANRRYFEMGVEHFRDFEERWPGILKKVITRKVPFDDFEEALERRKEDIKTVLII